MSTVAIIVAVSLLGFIVYWILKDQKIQSLRKVFGTVAQLRTQDWCSSI